MASSQRHTYVTTPRLAELRLAGGIGDEEAAEILREQHHTLATLRAVENGRAILEEMGCETERAAFVGSETEEGGGEVGRT